MESLKEQWMGSLRRMNEQQGVPAGTFCGVASNAATKNVAGGWANAPASTNASGTHVATAPMQPGARSTPAATSNYDRSRDPRMKGR